MLTPPPKPPPTSHEHKEEKERNIERGKAALEAQYYDLCAVLYQVAFMGDYPPTLLARKRARAFLRATWGRPLPLEPPKHVSNLEGATGPKPRRGLRRMGDK